MGCFWSCDLNKEATLIDGRKYLICAEIAEGGFSVVELIKDVQTGSMFALKRILCHGDDDERQAEREMNYHKLFSHPNLLKLRAFEVVRPSYYSSSSVTARFLMVFPLYKRGTLQNELDRLAADNDNIDEERILRLLRGIVAGLSQLHHHEPNPIAHRDLKPANILLSDDDIPVLMDFGSTGDARISVTDRSAATIVQDMAAEKCSMPYRAPELFNVEPGTEITEMTDMWSLGCVLYAMLFGQGPFDGVHQRGDSVALAVQSGKLYIPSDHSYSDELITILDDLLQFLPDDRAPVDVIESKITSLYRRHVISV